MILVQHPTFIDRNGKLIEDFGIETQGGSFAAMLKNGRSVPCEATFTFSTFEDNQAQITLALYRGTGELTRFNRFVGKIQVVDIPLAPARAAMIAITFHISTEAISVSAVDKVTGNPMQIRAVD